MALRQRKPRCLADLFGTRRNSSGHAGPCSRICKRKRDEERRALPGYVTLRLNCEPHLVAC
jgi:hypothetical protein